MWIHGFLWWFLKTRLQCNLLVCLFGDIAVLLCKFAERNLFVAAGGNCCFFGRCHANQKKLLLSCTVMVRASSG